MAKNEENRPRRSLSEKDNQPGENTSDSSKTNKWTNKLLSANGVNKAIDMSKKRLKKSGKSTKSSNSSKGSKAYVSNFFKDAPKGKVAAFVWWLHPKRQYQFWFNRQGLILGGQLTGLAIASVILLFMILYIYYARTLPNPREIGFNNLATKFYDRTGEHLLYSIYGDENRTLVEFDQISSYAKNATVAIEDKSFYDHAGVSPTGILRASVNNVLGKPTQGGSTITQQYVKNALLTKERSFERKIKEAILALELERLFTKDEILGFYLNEIPYGGTAYGIEAAAQSFFGKPARDLTIDESAMLAALPQAPTFYSPYGENTEKLKGRAHHIIGLMEEQGYISSEEAKAAKEVDVLAKVNKDFKPYRDIKAPYLVLEVQQRLERQFGAQVVASAGWKVITTVDLDLQQKAEKSINDNLGVLDKAGANNASIVATDPNTGQVLAAAGRDFNNPEFGKFNIAFTAKRQPGSSVKPYTYATLMRENYGAGSIFYDLKTDFGGNYIPGNADDRFKGAMTMRESLAQSRNIPAIKALYMAGLENVMQTWRDVGLVSSDLNPSRHGLSFALGSAEVKVAEHVNGFETFANRGIHHDQALWLKIVDKDGGNVDEWKQTEGRRVFDPQIADIINDILSDEAARASLFGRTARFLTVDGVQLAAKTGTTNSRRDAWLMGYSTCISTGLWVGHTRNQTLDVVTPSLVGPIWNDFMRMAHEGKKCDNFKKADGIKTVTLDKYTGRLPLDNSSNRITDIFPSHYKASEAGRETYTIDTVSGKLATDCTPESAKKTVTSGGISAEIPPEDPAFPRWNGPVQAWAASLGQSGGSGAKPTSNDDVHNCNDQKPNIGSVSVDKVGTQYRITANNVTKGTHGLKQLDFKIDGQIVSGGSMSISANGTYSVDVTVSPGNHTAQVVVTDTALYSSQKEKGFTAEAIAPLTITQAKEKTVMTEIKWSGNDGSVTVYRKSDNFTLCSSGGSSCNTAKANAPSGTQIYAKDSSGKTSSTATVD